MAPRCVLSDYVSEALRQAVYDKLGNGSYVGRIPACQGVIAFASDLRDCEEELRSTLEDWILLGLRAKHPLPVIAGIDLNREGVRDATDPDLVIGRRPQAAGLYQYVIEAPPGLKTRRVREVARQIGKSQNTVLRHIGKIKKGEITDNGLPLMRRPGPPPGYGANLNDWMRELIRNQSPSATGAHCLRLILNRIASEGSKQPAPSRHTVQRFIRGLRRAGVT